MDVKTDRDPLDPAVAALLLLTAVMLGVRMIAARTVGFGDSEALYATYALHPQPAYLDHPGLVGIFASALGGGTIPSPQAAHVATAALATMIPWLVVIVSRRLGANARAAAIAGLVVAATPELAVGLFAMTPDLLLAYTWLAFLGVAAMALDSEPGSARASAMFAVAGVIAGVAATAKVTGLFLVPALALAVWLDGRHRRSAWAWIGMAASIVPLLPIVRFEAASGFPMLRHRFIGTQHGAGLSLRNLGALLGGQLVYVSPVLVVIAVIVARDLVRHRRDDAIARLLFWTFALPLVPLVAFCLWSRVAEPHWIAPPLLALPIHAARRALTISRKLVVAGVITGLALAGAVYAWVLSPSLLRYAPASYDAKVDIANELYGWPQATRAASEMLEEGEATDGIRRDAWLVGPSWMVCAQLQVNVPAARVGCATDGRTDFDDWAPSAKWKQADVIVFVTDDRMPVDPQTLIPSFYVERTSRVSVLRGGRIVRTFRLSLLEKRAAG
jgi:hypothetical protein